MDGTAILTTIKYWRYLLKLSTISNRVLYGINHYFRKPVRIVVLGCSGSGKSQFIESLLDTNQKLTLRTRIVLRKRLNLEDGRKIEIVDTPGQLTMVAARKKIYSQFTQKKIRGIINLVNYGYCESEIVNSSNVFKAGTNEVKDEYLKDNRKRELEQLSEWINDVTSNTEIKWIITIVNKADIWYANRQEIIDYYENGKYFQIIKTLKSCCDIYTFPYCSIITPFCNKPMLLNFSEREKISYHDDLKNHLIMLVNGKNEKNG